MSTSPRTASREGMGCTSPDPRRSTPGALGAPSADPPTASPPSSGSRVVGSCPDRNRSGTDATVRAFSVTPSPSTPFPRVTARSRTPSTYTSSSEDPSSFGSTR